MSASTVLAPAPALAPFPALAEGSLVAVSADGVCLRVGSAAEVTADTVSTDLVDAGWRFATFSGTGVRVFVRPAGRRWLAAWSCWVWAVQVAEVETAVAEFDGRFSVVAVLGAVRPGRKWFARMGSLA